MLTDCVPDGEGDDPVVFRDGEVVAMCNTNSRYFTNFVASSTGNYTLGYNVVTFDDTNGYWGEKSINYVANREIFGGVSESEFMPDMPMTRGMFATVLGRMRGIAASDIESIQFEDVNPDSYYSPYISWCVSKGIMEGKLSEFFAPETPVTRGDMAVSLERYIRDFGFDIQTYLDVVEFEDIADCSEDMKEAVDFIQKAGIISGKSGSLFDPEGILTRGEAAAICERLIKVILRSNYAETELTAEEISRKRIRIGAWAYGADIFTIENFKTMYNLGVDLVVHSASSSPSRREFLLNMSDIYGVEVFLNDFSLVKADDSNNAVDPVDLSAEYYDHPSFGGHFFTDEPGSDSFGWMGDVANDYMEKMPGKIPFVNLLPMYANAAQLKYGAQAADIEYYDPDPDLYRKHCQMWFENFDTDYICTDIYPLNWSAGKKTTYGNYIESINQIATVARENNAEFWCCIQAFGWTPSKRTPTEAEYRWQCYSLLSFGCTGILIWSYAGNENYPSVVHPVTNEPTEAYYDCKTVMWEMHDISDVFVEYKNLGAFTHNYTDKVPYLRMSGEYDKSLTVFEDIKCDNPLLFGYFEKISANGNAFTVVNMTEFEDDTSSVVSFKLSDAITKVTSYYRGVENELTADSQGYYTINLECGDGAFVTVE